MKRSLSVLLFGLLGTGCATEAFLCNYPINSENREEKIVREYYYRELEIRNNQIFCIDDYNPREKINIFTLRF